MNASLGKHMKQASDLLCTDDVTISTPHSCFLCAPFAAMSTDATTDAKAILSTPPPTDTVTTLSQLHTRVRLPVGMYCLIRVLNHADREVGLGNGIILMSLDHIIEHWQEHTARGQSTAVAVGGCYLGMGHIALVCMVVNPGGHCKARQTRINSEKCFFKFHVGGSNGWDRTEREDALWALDARTIPASDMCSWCELLSEEHHHMRLVDS